MKKLLFIITLLTSAVFFISCSKSDPGENPSLAGNTNPTIRYEFNSDIPATYKLMGTGGTAAFDETTTGTSWTKTMQAVRSGSGADSASLIVTPPDAWQNTTTTANVTLKIFVDNVQKGTKSFPMVWLDRAAGYEVRTKF